MSDKGVKIHETSQMKEIGFQNILSLHIEVYHDIFKQVYIYLQWNIDKVCIKKGYFSCQER